MTQHHERAPSAATLAHLADLGDVVLNVARLMRACTPAGAELVSLNETERLLMRLIDLNPGCTPSDISRRARLQRTNVSTALTSLATKGMITRTRNGGRTVTVEATQLAADNLQALRHARAEKLFDMLHGDIDDVRRCTELLAHLEARLDAAEAGSERPESSAAR